MRDPADFVESAVPRVDRLLVGEFDEQPGYRVVRSRGTTDWLLVHTVAGTGWFHGADGAVVTAAVDTTTLVPPGVRHDYGIAPTAAHWHLLFAHFHPGPEWLALLGWPEVSAGIRQLGLTARLSQRVSVRLREAISQSTAPDLRLTPRRHGDRLAANALEAALLWCDSRNQPRGAVDQRVLSAAEFVDQHLTEELDVQRLADAVGLSPSRLTHLFAGQLGMPPQRFIEQRRMASARRLLELTSRPVSTIAADVGYDNPLYFSTRFRRHTGLSPTAYRVRREAAPDPDVPR